MNIDISKTAFNRWLIKHFLAAPAEDHEPNRPPIEKSNGESWVIVNKDGPRIINPTEVSLASKYITLQLPYEECEPMASGGLAQKSISDAFAKYYDIGPLTEIATISIYDSESDVAGNKPRALEFMVDKESYKKLVDKLLVQLMGESGPAMAGVADRKSLAHELLTADSKLSTTLIAAMKHADFQADDIRGLLAQASEYERYEMRALLERYATTHLGHAECNALGLGAGRILSTAGSDQSIHTISPKETIKAKLEKPAEATAGDMTLRAIFSARATPHEAGDLLLDEKMTSGKEIRGFLTPQDQPGPIDVNRISTDHDFYVMTLNPRLPAMKALAEMHNDPAQLINQQLRLLGLKSAHGGGMSDYIVLKAAPNAGGADAAKDEEIIVAMSQQAYQRLGKTVMFLMADRDECAKMFDQGHHGMKELLKLHNSEPSLMIDNIARNAGMSVLYDPAITARVNDSKHREFKNRMLAVADPNHHLQPNEEVIEDTVSRPVASHIPAAKIINTEKGPELRGR